MQTIPEILRRLSSQPEMGLPARQEREKYQRSFGEVSCEGNLAMQRGRRTQFASLASLVYFAYRSMHVRM